MERSAIHVLAKRGKSIRQIAAEVGHSPTTISRVLKEPVDKAPTKWRRRSKADPYRPQIEQWVREGLTAARMLELVRAEIESQEVVEKGRRRVAATVHVLRGTHETSQKGAHGDQGQDDSGRDVAQGVGAR